MRNNVRTKESIYSSSLFKIFFVFSYYVDHNTRRTHWEHPLKQEILPPGWVKRFTQEQGVVYYK